MKTLLTTTVCILLTSSLVAQDRTIVNAKNSEISDNLDLRALASIFGESKNLEDFEQRINDPNAQISNLDLNEDNQVDYLRIVESVEGNTHLVVVQSVLGKDTYQDVATIEVEKDLNNQVQIQVVGDVYMYGPDYIYEPVYVHTPVIYSTFWAPVYRPYVSVWYWNYYPKYYVAWNPWPVFRYRNHIGIHINFHNHYNYVNVRKCSRAVVMYQPIRANYCERSYPQRSFVYRNNNYRNRYELDQTRKVKYANTRNDVGYNYSNRNNTRNNNTSYTRNGQGIRYESNSGTRNSANQQANHRSNSASNDQRVKEPRDQQYKQTRNKDGYKSSQRNQDVSGPRARDNSGRASERSNRRQ
ncbi:hypothetical protein KIH23_12220 [Flavobacterium sp. CYK-55]|uniref:hypothetical protein n=1 Tax=Flavobacterium sp. CYK-55 TaxID=2835529 RepID=UPI001BD16E07|nr:hypothetical protein [Flavobacterium sp. CYK-55]MBS7788064.1 hypothetical protein [Flavobacterium sp. CYK-55]